MTALSIAITCAQRLQLPAPSAFIGSVDNNMILLKVMIEKAMQEIRNEYPWPELNAETTFTLATGVASYALPADFDRFQFETLWNRTQKWPLIGPLDPVDWQNYKSGLVTSFPRQRFRVKGWADNQLYVDPTPTSSENGQVIAFEYVSRSVVKPKTWVTGTSWLGLLYCSYNGNNYTRGSTGAANTGVTPPTHTTGTVSDGTINWTYFNTPFEGFTYDSDNVILDNQMVIDGAVWRYKKERRIAGFMEDKEAAEDELERAKTRLQGAGVLSVGQRNWVTPMIGPWSYPDGNFNGA